jgi:hypothetical protein
MKKIVVLFFALISVALTSCRKENIDETKGCGTHEQHNGDTITGQTRAASQTPYYWANSLVTNILPQDNSYQLGMDLVQWTGQHGATAYRCSTVCSGLLTQVLIQTYNYTSAYFRTWTGSSDPNSARYYNEVITHDHFTQINTVNQVAQGDFIFLKYPTGSGSSGHTMIVAAAPTVRTASTPVVSGTTQYEVSVIDCSESGHGSTDTRYISNGVWHTGVGKGIFRLYVNPSGSIVGYCWSTYSNSTYYTQSVRQLAVGRLIP